MTSNPVKDIVRYHFYESPGYHDTTTREFAQKGTLPPIYTLDTENKVVRIAKRLLSIIIFPIGLCQLFHRLVGKIFIIASSPFLQKHLLKSSLRPPHEARQHIPFDSDAGFGYKRITVECDGHSIDAMILLNKINPSSRWGLFAGPNGGSYEHMLTVISTDKSLLQGIGANGIFFNYPGVGASSGLPSKNGMIKAYNAMLTMLEDKEKGFGAKEIIGFASSFVGGGVQGEVLRTHQLKNDIRYVFVKDRAASSVANIASSIIPFVPLGFLVKAFGWDFDAEESSKKLTAPEIILQTASVTKHEKITRPEIITHDGSIPQKATLAYTFLKTRRTSNKTFIGIPEDHIDPIIDTSFLSTEINDLLKRK